MDLDRLQELTGTTVTSSQMAKVAANIDRCRAKLETKLGYPLDPEKVTQNLYTETGKVPGDGFFAFNLDTVTLEDPDEVIGAYRVFPFHEADQLLHVDPFSAIHAVKLVRGSVTLRTLDADDYSIHAENNGLKRYIALTWPLWRTWIGRAWDVYGDRGVQLAVDADWLWPETDEGSQDIPDDLAYVWADHVAWLSDDTRFIKSENRGTRSYTKSEVKPPLGDVDNQQTIAKYAGPNGTAGRMPV
jgi:hypothetical protein